MLIQVILRRSVSYTSYFYIFLVFFCLSSCGLSDPPRHEPLKIPKYNSCEPTVRESSSIFKNQRGYVYLVHGIGDNDISVLTALLHL